MKKKIANTLLLLGIPVNQLGYQYLKEALAILSNDQMAVHSMAKTVYIPVAEKFDSTASKVERSMRHSIEAAAAGRSELFTKYFPRIGKPCNSEFLAMVAEMLRLDELEKEETA